MLKKFFGKTAGPASERANQAPASAATPEQQAQLAAAARQLLEGKKLQAQGRLDEAIACFESALGVEPARADAFRGLADVFMQLNRIPEAAASFHQIATLDPGNAFAHYNLGNILFMLGRLDGALAALKKAIELKPDLAVAWGKLGHVYKAQNDAKQALAHWRRAAAVDPLATDALAWIAAESRMAGDWSGFAAEEAAVLDAVHKGSEHISPLGLVFLRSTPEDQLRNAQNYARGLKLPAAAGFSARKVKGRDRIRLGYLSSDFHNHATVHLITELFELHDRSRFEVNGYSLGKDDGSAERKRLTKAFDRFVDFRKDAPPDPARAIFDDGIDILIDLKGFTADHRAQIMARRPAPIQVNYLGFPGTMGVDFIDYMIVDHTVVPKEHEPFYAERLVYLPDCYQANDRKRAIAPRIPTRAECGLPESGFVFCCLSAPEKIAPAFFDVWMRLLAAVPGSVLWLRRANTMVEPNLRKEAQQRGIDPARLVFAPNLPLAEHLARHQAADLFLDTLPCNAHTTMSDALWAGLPALTCLGETFAGRVGASLLRAVGLPELVTTSLADYEALALALASSPARLAELRQRLAANRMTAPLFDAPRFARHIEDAFTQMQELRRGGQKPRPLEVRPFS